MTAGKKSQIALVRTSDRKAGINRAIALLGINPVKGKQVMLKPNFNTADEYPGSTHNDTLIELILKLKEMGAEQITVADRAGPTNTAAVLRDKGIYDICKEHGVALMNIEELPPDQWVTMTPEQSSWRKGFDFAKPALDAECIVTTGCLKTHRFGAEVTISLKLSIGLVHKKNMTELHTSTGGMRKMIAEVNQVYEPSLIVIDALDTFVDGGPMTGKRARADIMYAGTDRIAVDAVGIAILKELGAKKAIMDRKIFEQEQIARAVELGLGVTGPEDIEILADDKEGTNYADRLHDILLQG